MKIHSPKCSSFHIHTVLYYFTDVSEYPPSKVVHFSYSYSTVLFYRQLQRFTIQIGPFFIFIRYHIILPMFVKIHRANWSIFTIHTVLCYFTDACEDPPSKLVLFVNSYSTISFYRQLWRFTIEIGPFFIFIQYYIILPMFVKIYCPNWPIFQIHTAL